MQDIVKMFDYEVVQASTKDSKEVLDFVAEHFVPHEPMNKAVKLVEPGYRIPFFDNWLESYLRQEDTVSVVARHSQTGEMLGVCVVEMERVNIKSYSPPPAETGPSYSVCPEKLKKVFQFLDCLKEELDIARDYGVEEWGDVVILACRSDLRTPGLGTELVSQAIKRVQDRGVKVFTATATSYYSGRIFDKLGFTTLKEWKYEDYVLDGNVVFTTSLPHTSAKQFIKL